MKTRNGFVSNSSSSSFVVAFPKKPKCSCDVLEFMFGGKEGGVGLECYEDGLSYRQVSEIVFKDIDRTSWIVLKDLTEALKYRYHYYANVYRMGWGEEFGRYFGSDQGATEELKKESVDFEDKEREFRLRESEIEEKKFKMKRPKFAYESGIDPHTKQPYTKEEIETSKKFEKALGNFHETDPDYLALRKKQREYWDKHHKREDEIRKRIATSDAKNFLEDNKDGFIFMVTYGDENGQIGATMEHGNIFRNVPHICINQH